MGEQGRKGEREGRKCARSLDGGGEENGREGRSSLKAIGNGIPVIQ